MKIKIDREDAVAMFHVKQSDRKEAVLVEPQS
jgi:hypothetical protein